MTVLWKQLNQHPQGNIVAEVTTAEPGSQSERSLFLALAAARVASDSNAQNIVILDMRKSSSLFDYFLIATGTSQRHLNSIAEDIQHHLERELHDKRVSNHAIDRSSWIVLDYGTVVIHLFDEETRQFYSLEALWGDAVKVDWEAAK